LVVPSLFFIQPLWKEVEEGWLRYDSVSGETLLLSDFASCVLKVSETNDVSSFESLFPLLSREFPELQPAELDSALRLAMASLSEADLLKIS